MLKKPSLPLLAILPLGAFLYRPIWTFSESLFFLLTGAYLILVSEIAKRRRLT